MQGKLLHLELALGGRGAELAEIDGPFRVLAGPGAVGELHRGGWEVAAEFGERGRSPAGQHPRHLAHEMHGARADAVARRQVGEHFVAQNEATEGARAERQRHRVGTHARPARVRSPRDGRGFGSLREQAPSLRAQQGRR